MFLYGLDEKLIKSSIDPIIKKVLDKDFLDLNFIKIDGLTSTFDEIENACETLPFFGDKKVVLVYKFNFEDKPDKEGAKTYTNIKIHKGFTSAYNTYYVLFI